MAQQIQSFTTPTSSTPLNIPALQDLMLNLINENRQQHGLQPVAWDDTAALAGLRHAQEMSRFAYLNHWNLAVNDQAYFEMPLQLNYQNQPGLYHIRIWAETQFGQTLVADVVVRVKGE